MPKQNLFDIVDQNFGRLDELVSVANDNDFSLNAEVTDPLIINDYEGDVNKKDAIALQGLTFNNDWVEADVEPPSGDAFIFTIDTSLGAGDTFTLPLRSGYNYNFVVNWGDSSTDTITAYNDPEITKTYSSGGTYNISITGTCEAWSHNFDGDNGLKVKSIVQWGETGFISMYRAFAACENLDTMLDTTGTWCSNVTDFNGFFIRCFLFNGVVSSWDVSNSTAFLNMFDRCYVFNQPLNSWNVSSGIDFREMFLECYVFNQPLNSWNMSNAENIRSMFRKCYVFNQPFNSWDTIKVTDMAQMFYDCWVFNQDISFFNTSLVAATNNMFRNAFLFNQPLNSWDMSSNLQMDGMFWAASAFDQPFNLWNTSNVIRMRWMFQDTSFDQNISSWDVTDLEYASDMFSGTTLSTVNYDALLIGWAAQSVQTGVTFNGGNSQYSAGAATTARGVLTTTYSWIITDGGQV